VTTNTVVLIIVALVVALVLAGVVMIFGYKLRAERRLLGGGGVLDEMTADALASDVLNTKAHVAHVDSEIAAFRDRGRKQESADSRDTADMRAQLKDHGTLAD
jgi:hypothetical protein